MSLKLKQKKKQKKKRRFCLKKWFDFECNTARKELTRQPSDQKHYNSSNSIRGVAREIPEPPYLSFLLDNATRTDPVILPSGRKFSHLLYADDLRARESNIVKPSP